MAIHIQSTDKQNFIAIVRTAPYPGGADEADRLQSILNNYEDVATAIYRQLDLYNINYAYLRQCMLALNTTLLQSVGIYFSLTGASLVNPVMLINSVYDTVEMTLSSPPNLYELGLLGGSRIKTLLVDAGVEFNELYIGPGCAVDVLNGAQVSSPPASPPISARINKIYLPFVKNTPSTLSLVQYGTQIGQVVVEPGSYYGGVQGNNPDLACSAVVTGITATELTKNSVYLSWTPPGTYTFINTFFRKKGGHVWILASDADGDFEGDSGFTFRDLELDTYYEFKVSTVCLNGGFADVIVAAQTGCCGSGNAMTLYNSCEINVTIKDTPNTSKITLCNGIQIDAQYPSGATLVIPYLVNKIAERLVVIDNANYQKFPFDQSTGTFNAAATTLGVFVDGNVVTVHALLPSM